jgi:hypothetical protein
LSIASLVLGILWILGIGSILALIFGYVGLRQIRRRDENGRGMAIAGIVLGWVGVGGILFLITLGIIGSNTSSKNNSAPPPTVEATTPTSPAGPTSVESNPAPAATPGQTQSFVVGSWWNAVAVDVATVNFDMAYIQLGSGLSNSNGNLLKGACDGLTGDVQFLKHDPAPTVPAINAPWQTALNLYARAGSECSAKAGAAIKSGLKAAVQDSAAADKQLSLVDSRVRAFGIDSDQLPTGVSIPLTSNTALGNWWNQILDDYINVPIDLQLLNAAANSLSYSAVQAACRELVIYVQTLQKDPAPPASTPWQAGLKLYAQGAAQCASASNPVPPDMKGLLAANADIGSGNRDMAAVNDDVSAAA